MACNMASYMARIINTQNKNTMVPAEMPGLRFIYRNHGQVACVDPGVMAMAIR